MERSESSDWNVPNDLPENPTGTSILDLNQYCLLQVFAHLDVYDAIHFGETCKTLHIVAQLAMIKYKDFDLIEYQKYFSEASVPAFGNCVSLPAWARRSPFVPLRKVLSYVAPHIASLDARTELIGRSDFSSSTYGPEVLRKRAESLHTFLQFDMPKLKSLTVQSSNDLAYIMDRRSIDKLKIYEVHSSDLNIYTSCFRNLIQLHLISIKQAHIEEISAILDNNPTIDDLCLISTIEHRSQRAITANSIRKLPHLKRLELSIGCNASDIWKSILQLQHLTALALIMRSQLPADTQSLQKFLEELAKRNTVRSITLKGLDLCDDSVVNRLLKSLALMNLNSLCIENSSYSSWFYTALTRRTQFQTLQSLELQLVPDIGLMMLIIERFESLERLVLQAIMSYADSRILSRRINELLKVIPTTRSDVKVEMVGYGARFTISFRHGTHDIVSWPEPCNQDTQKFSFTFSNF